MDGVTLPVADGAEPYLTARQLADALGIRESTIRQWTSRDDVDIPVTYLGRLTRYRLSRVSAWLEAGAFTPCRQRSRRRVDSGPPVAIGGER